MWLKLESITGVREAGEHKLWEIIEGIYQDSNPTYIRRLKVYELQMIKGEQAGDFATRLKLDYEESEMAKATVWSHFQYNYTPLWEVQIYSAPPRHLGKP